jgi:hypothetical protein
MKLNDERRKVLTKYLGLCWHEGRMPINCGYRCVKCGDTYVANRTFDNDADMMALYRKMVDVKKYDEFRFLTKERLTFALPFGTFSETWLLYYPERFCNLVAEWLEVKK